MSDEATATLEAPEAINPDSSCHAALDAASMGGAGHEEPSAISQEHILNELMSIQPSFQGKDTPMRNCLEVTIIRPGLSKAQLAGIPVTYSEEALRNSVPLWAGATCFSDHLNKSVRNIVGVFYDPVYEEGQGVKAKLRVIDEPAYRFLCQMIADTAQGLPVPDLGISADIVITATKGDQHVAVTAINEVISADLVFAPAAGGSFDRILNSVRDKIPTPPDDTFEKRIRDLQSSNDKLRLQLKNQAAELHEALKEYRISILNSRPEIPGELIAGTTVQEINASVDKASRLVAQVQKAMDDKGSEQIPAGAPARRGPDLTTMSAREKIVEGLRLRQP